MPYVQIGANLYAARHYIGGRRTYHNSGAANLTAYAFNTGHKAIRTLEASRSALRSRLQVPDRAIVLDGIDGFDHQALSVNRFGGATTTGLYVQVDNVPGMSFIAGRTGGLALRVASSGTATRLKKEFAANGGHRIFSAYLRVAGALTNQIEVFDCGFGASGADLRINTTTGAIVPSIGGVIKTTGPVVADGQWHLIDWYLDSSANPWVMRYAVDGVQQPMETQAIAADTTSNSNFWFGHSTTAPGQAFDYDDFVYSSNPASYPIGPHKVLTLVPDHDGTHNAGTNVMENETGTDIGVTNAWSELDEWPPTLAGYVQQAATGASNYAEAGFPDTTEETVWGAEVVAAMFSAGTTANSATTRIVDSNAGGATVVDIYTGDMSETVAHYRRVMVPITDVGQFNALRVRMGFATSVGSIPRWDALMLQYAVPEVEGAATPTASDSGTAEDTSDLTVALLEDDVATGSDVSDLAADYLVADTGLGVEGLTDLDKPGTDTAIGADVSALTAVLTATDAATSADTITAVARPVTQAGSSTESSSVFAAGTINASDSASSSDSTSLTTDQVEGFESAAFQEVELAFQMAPSLPQPAEVASVLGALTQAITATTNIGKFGSDAGTASDVVVTMARAVTESATAIDAFSILARSVTDAAVGADASALTAVRTVTDIGAGANTAALAAALAVTDAATGAEASAVQTALTADVESILSSLVQDATADTEALGEIESILPSLIQSVTIDLIEVPQNLIAVAVSTNEIDLVWDVFIGAAAYDIERDGVTIVFDHPTETYDDVGLAPETLYTYRVRAVV